MCINRIDLHLTIDIKDAYLLNQYGGVDIRLSKYFKVYVSIYYLLSFCHDSFAVQYQGMIFEVLHEKNYCCRACCPCTN